MHEVLFTAPGVVEAAPIKPLKLKDDELGIKAICSGVSWGSESKFLKGAVCPELNSFDSFHQDSKKRFPARYGYCHVGTVDQVGPNCDSNLLNKRVFSFSHHQSYVAQRKDSVLTLDDSLPSERATLIPNMETALSIVVDAQPLIGARVVVIGLGVVGQLTLSLLKGMPLQSLVGVDRDENRIKMAKRLVADTEFYGPDQHSYKDIAPQIVIELTGNPKALEQAIDMVDVNGRIIVGSMYGDVENQVCLDSRFHRKRISLVSSQVSNLGPNSHVLGKNDRLKLAMRELGKRNELDQLITHREAIQDCDKLYQCLGQGSSGQGILTY